MNANFGSPYFDRYTMGEDPATTTTAAPSNAASIIDSITKGLTQIASAAITTFGAQPTGTTTPTGAPVINIPAPTQRSGMDPTMLMAIGIPAVVILAAIMMKGNRR